MRIDKLCKSKRWFQFDSYVLIPVPALLYNTYNGEFNDVKGCSIANSAMHFSWMELIEFAVQTFDLLLFTIIQYWSVIILGKQMLNTC